ncbi:NAD(P)-dependent oxidoreductase [Brachybacterium sacelli]
MKRVAFVGLGIMGAPMARNAGRAGWDVIGHTRTPASRERARAQGIEVVDDLAQAVRGADVLVTVLPDAPDVSAVLLEDGALDLLDRGALVIDASTVAPAASQAIHEACAARGLTGLDAPVSGGEAGAVDGVLSFMVGGEQEAFDRARPLLESMGTTIERVGPAGAGQTVKAANQLLVAGHLQLLSEALVLLERAGVDPGPAVRVLGGGLAGSTVMQRKASNMLAHDYRPGFRLDLHRKDLRIVSDTAQQDGLSLPLTAAVTQLVNALVARGVGGLDHSALHALTRQLNGARDDA